MRTFTQIIYWFISLAIIGFNVVQGEYLTAIIVFLLSLILHVIIFGFIWKSDRAKGGSSFFDNLDCDCGGDGDFGGGFGD